MRYKGILPLIKVFGFAMVTLVIFTSVIGEISKDTPRISRDFILMLAIGPIVFGSMFFLLQEIRSKSEVDLEGVLLDVIISVFHVTLLGINSGLILGEIYTLIQWNSRPEDSRFEPLFSLIAFVVVIVEYLRRRSNADHELNDEDEENQAQTADS